MNLWKNRVLGLLCILLLSTALYTFTELPNTNWGELIDQKIDRIQHYVADRYLQRMSQLDNVSSLPSGLLFTIVKRGHGDRAPAPDDICEVRYTSRFRCNLIFEDTKRNPHPIHRAPSQMPRGVKEAMELMREGDRWHLYVPYHLAFGEMGDAGQGVPPWSNFVYNIEICKCFNPKGKTSEMIDAYLKTYAKRPLSEKMSETYYEGL